MKVSKQMEEGENMKRYVITLGTLLITIVLMSGSAAATWFYVTDITTYEHVMNRYEILDGPNDIDASLGETILGTDFLGQIWLYFGDFVYPTEGDTITIFGGGGTSNETYKFRLACDNWPGDTCYTDWDTGNSDQTDNDMTVPANCDDHDEPWRHVIIYAETGSSDPIYGPEIDAVSCEH